MTRVPDNKGSRRWNMINVMKSLGGVSYFLLFSKFSRTVCVFNAEYIQTWPSEVFTPTQTKKHSKEASPKQTTWLRLGRGEHRGSWNHVWTHAKDVFIIMQFVWFLREGPPPEGVFSGHVLSVIAAHYLVIIFWLNSVGLPLGETFLFPLKLHFFGVDWACFLL